MASRSPRASAPSSPFLSDDEMALLASPNTPSGADSRASFTDGRAGYAGALSSLPGARKLAPRPSPRGSGCALPPPRLLLPLVVALALVASVLLLTQGARNTLAQYLPAPATSEQPHRLRDAFFDAPPWPLDARGFGILDAAEDEHTVTAIVVHGLGDKGDGLPWTAALADRFPFVRWVAPTADYLNVTVRNGATTRAWFNIVTFDDIWGDEDVVGYTHSQQQLNQLIDDERREMLESGKEARIVLLGFSQGGVMTLLATLTAPRADRIEAAAVMSTYLPLVDSFDDVLSSAARDTPLLWVHGRADPYLTYANAELSLARLTSPPISLSDVAFSGYDGVQHSWNGDMLDDVAAWFEDKVPRWRRAAGAGAGGKDRGGAAQGEEEEGEGVAGEAARDKHAGDHARSGARLGEDELLDGLEEEEEAALLAAAEADDDLVPVPERGSQRGRRGRRRNVVLRSIGPSRSSS